MGTDLYTEPLVSRYTSKHMQALFSPDNKFRTWKKCWIALAESQRELGLTEIITEEALLDMKANDTEIDYDTAAAKEKELRHDVMAHVYAYGGQAPKAAGIIHLGATSQYVVCNTDLSIQRDALASIKRDLIKAISGLAQTVERLKGVPVLGATHFQVAQPTTMGKRFTLAIQDLLMDLDALEWVEKQIHARGAKGTTGTQATFLKLFKGDKEKVLKLDEMVSQKLGFERSFAVTGQTYPRKLDTKIVEVLAGIGASAHWVGTNIRLLSGLKELDEPFEKKQVGSSAMAYKRNPMRSERMCSLARKLMNLPANFHATHANQWLERTLDDSAIRRMDIPQAFLLTDAVLGLLINVGGGLIANTAAINNRMKVELPFLATEEILMASVEKGASRQVAHEVVRDHSVEVARLVKDEGRPNDLLDRLAADDRIPLDAAELQSIAGDPVRFIGLSVAQVDAFLCDIVNPRLAQYGDVLTETQEERVQV
ncbi:MAG: adenylosuccinate lyase [Deltaproteobacteria bacterium]|nr:adenylosuccinate lyase [Deltaproteobacteria bacterium]